MFNAIVDSTVSHFHRKDREAASTSKPKGVLKPIFKKWMVENELGAWPASCGACHVMVTDGNMAWCAMTMACPCMTCHVWTRDVLPWLRHHVHVWHDMEFAWKTCHAGVIIHVQGGHGGLLGGQVWGGFSASKKLWHQFQQIPSWNKIMKEPIPEKHEEIIMRNILERKHSVWIWSVWGFL